MRVNRGLLGWGVFFVAVGAVPLAVRAGAQAAVAQSSTPAAHRRGHHGLTAARRGRLMA